MLLVGTILPAGAGAQLWQLAGAAPDNIELNTTAGAAGILAELPANNLFKLVLASIAGQDFFEAGSVDNVNQVYTRIRVQNEIALFQYLDAINGKAASFEFDASAANPDVSIYASAVGNSAGQQIKSDFIQNTIVVALTDEIATQLNANYFSVRDGAGAPVFQVRKDGQLETNQTAASVAVRVKVAELPIYDTAGLLVGYININT